MPLSTYPQRILLTSAGTSALVLATAIVFAVYLSRFQGQTEYVLNENIESRRAAASLIETLGTLIKLHEKNASPDEVSPLHDEVRTNISEIVRYADKDEERVDHAKITAEFNKYQKEWEAAPATPADSKRLAKLLSDNVLPVCVHLREFNAEQIEKSEQPLQRSLRRMTWGLAVIAGLTSIAGLVLGFGLARGLRRTIHQILIRVQGATELLNQELPAVDWTPRTNDPSSDDAHRLVHQVEQVVQKLQQRDREVRRAERLAAVGQLAAGVAHEIRNPLTSINLLIQTSRRDPAAGGLSTEDLELIEHEIQRLERSVQTFLDYARPPKLQRSACDLVALIRRTLSLVRGRAEGQNVELQFAEPAVPMVLDVDAEQLQQVLVNLVLNALDAMPNGGKLEMAATFNQAKGVEIIVSDTGPGVAPEVRSRLFEPFATDKETGLGLGLVVSRRIVEDHGGTITEEGGLGGGARFAVRLPARPPAEAA
jgi:two-component system, NtrC family, sensor histidine kinase HydH